MACVSDLEYAISGNRVVVSETPTSCSRYLRGEHRAPSVHNHCWRHKCHRDTHIISLGYSFCCGTRNAGISAAGAEIPASSHWNRLQSYETSIADMRAAIAKTLQPFQRNQRLIVRLKLRVSAIRSLKRCCLLNGMPLQL